MKPAIDIELQALVEKLELLDLQKAAALIFKEWCFEQGASPETALEFFERIIEMQPDQARQDLGDLANTLRKIRLLNRTGFAGGPNH
ncbi:MAG: hypothetical protein KJ944_07245 [Alphaproteobacteria bacterium]|nr:hypothetical protein [Alphaproteobacteria bacterium]MBU1561641.1 hypothetical protein [Alphaproteobacteria bacterium]MBU2302378.1 hypothetical protein [Alphaproteobacteria bacterium]MBU2368658.1 hypothetical protein [Alphaproteobacteria bacterium]